MDSRHSSLSNVRNELGSGNGRNTGRILSGLTSTDSTLYFPDEILSTIFKLGQRMHHGNGDLSDPTRLERHFPLVISHVNHRWREISTNMATLWTRIDYGTVVDYATELRSSALVALYLRRSRDQPLDISLSSKHYSYQCGFREILRNPLMDLADVQCAIDMIFASVARWQSLHIKIMGSFDFEDAQIRFRDLAAPLLKRLWFDACGEPRSVGDDFHIFKGGTPSLEFVKLDGVAACWPPLATVRSLDLMVWDSGDNLIPSVLHDMFSRTVSLTTLHVPLGVILHPSHIHAIEIPTVRYLKIDGLSCRKRLKLTMLLDFISAPGLECLVLSDISSYQISRMSVSNSGLSKFPVLHTLKFSRTYGCDPISENLIRGLPNVTNLSLIYAPATNALHFLSTTALWPLLETLQLDIENAHTRQLQEMLRYRFHIGCPITKLRFLRLASNYHVVPDFQQQNLRVELFDWPTYDVEEDMSGFIDYR